jgi:hypothetical protein
VNTLKSTAVILVLAGVLYGVYTALNRPEAPPPAGMTAKDVEDMAPPQIELGGKEALTTDLPAPPSTLSLSSEGSSPAKLHSPGVNSAPSIYSSGGAEDPSPGSAPEASTAQGSTYNQRSSYESPAGSAAKGGPLSGSSSAEVGSNPAAASPALSAFAFRRDAQQAEQLVADGKFRAALATLSPYCGMPDLTTTDREQLLTWLDALAAKVIYSREHLLDAPYAVRGNQTLFEIAERTHVPAELLQNINGIRDPRVVLPGSELKIVPGPFRAEANLTTSELTLFLGDLYAGRFPFTLGNEPPQPGEYEVRDRQPDRTYYGPDGRTIAANDPANPYGQCWIDLGPAACIHGSPLAAAPGAQTLGCISLSPQDARDVYSILARGSKVAVRR